jgi:mRNA interferase MazF
MLRRGEVWWADFGEPRPVVLLLKAADAQFRCMQIVAPADIDITGHGLEVPLGAADGLSLEGVVRVVFPRPGLVPCTWLVAVTEEDVLECIGVLPQAKLKQIEEAMRLAGIPSE